MTAVHVINRTPSSSLDGKLPEEVWNGKSPDYSHFRTFDCTTYSHQNVGKLEARS